MDTSQAASLAAPVRYQFSGLKFTNHVTEAIGREDEKDAIRTSAKLVDSKVGSGGCLAFDLRERCVDVVPFKEASLLFRVTPVFPQAELHSVRRARNRLGGKLLSCHA